MAPYPMRVRIKSSASLNAPPGSVVDGVGFLIVFMFECVTVSPGAGAATARSSAILASSYNPQEYGAAAVAPVQKVRTAFFSP
jgi:hypothetical protein